MLDQELELQVGINSFADNAIEIGVRYWVPTEGYFQYKSQTNLKIFKALQGVNITIPFPQREVRLLIDNSGIAASQHV